MLLAINAVNGTERANSSALLGVGMMKGATATTAANMIRKGGRMRSARRA
jgi:hypothetical protein